MHTLADNEGEKLEDPDDRYTPPDDMNPCDPDDKSCVHEGSVPKGTAHHVLQATK